MLAAPPSDQAALPEAPASVTVKVLYKGFDVLLTLRGHDGRSVLGRLDAALGWLETHGATPATGSSSGRAETSTSGPAPVCPTHGRPMKVGRRGGWFCTAKLVDDDGTGKPVYCRQRINNGGG